MATSEYFNALKINGTNAYTAYGVTMGDQFIENLLLPPSLKERITNESRLTHGVQSIPTDKVASRQLSLSFRIHGETPSQCMSRLNAFKGILLAGSEIELSVIPLNKIFHLLYSKSSSVVLSADRCVMTLAVVFDENNPNTEEAIS
ncbi:MAG: hypothetical protein J6M59_10600 [Bacteroidaceae bacterium]|nr:hypothetical protein [Bacteroidaceae bacterium]